MLRDRHACAVRRAGLVPGVPLMRPTFRIRPARVEEASALSDLCFRSKAGFVALMPAALGIAGDEIATRDVWVATGADGPIAGVVALAFGDAPGALDLNKLSNRAVSAAALAVRC